MRGQKYIMSNAGDIVPMFFLSHCLYFKKIGLIVFSEENAPLLNLISPVPLVVVPSANIQNGAY